MIDCKAGDVLLVRFPFTEIDASKKRPALALHLVKVGRRSGLATIAMITSKIDGLTLTGDVRLEQWKEASLLHPSIVRLAKVATVDSTLVERRLGRMGEKDLTRIRQGFSDLFQFWV